MLFASVGTLAYACVLPFLYDTKLLSSNSKAPV